jgi:hypothetical protein
MGQPQSAKEGRYDESARIVRCEVLLKASKEKDREKKLERIDLGDDSVLPVEQ